MDLYRNYLQQDCNEEKSISGLNVVCLEILKEAP